MADGGDRIRLPGGGEVLLRALEPSDRELLATAFAGLGERSRHQRFMATKTSLTERELTYLTDVDHVDHEAIGARDAETGEGVGVARYVRDPERPATAEAAVTVVDAWQGRGLGTLLLDRLVERAEENGIERFSASFLIANRAVRHMLDEIGEVRVLRQGEGSMDVDVEFPVDRDALHAALRGAARRLAALAVWR
ncbi:MAG TPA: GNAT family N-acetyltransferase [Solirubrobacteraceae bacterium]|nr:GNAT family N-acetyltransferase [Solirubrobacteraceae bacterium]